MNWVLEGDMPKPVLKVKSELVIVPNDGKIANEILEKSTNNYFDSWKRSGKNRRMAYLHTNEYLGQEKL